MTQRPSPSRVARMHTAGLFEAPPRVLKAVTDWAISVYAGHILAQVEKRLDAPPDDTAKRMAQTEKYLDPEVLFSTIERMPEGNKTLRIPAGLDLDVVIKRPRISDPGSSVEGEDIQVILVRKGQRAKFPKEPDHWGEGFLDEIWDYRQTLTSIQGAVSEVRLYLERGMGGYGNQRTRQNIRERFSDETLVELSLLRREAMRYTSKAKSYKTKARTVLPVDLTGWEYVQGIPAAQIEQKLAEHNMTTFTCFMVFKQSKRRAGQWDGRKMEMELELHGAQGSANTVALFKKGIRRIRNVARHECLHLGQEALRYVKGLRTDAGLPSSDLIEPGDVGHRLPHARRKVEFYTRLADEISKFVVEASRTTLPLRRSYMRRWLNESPFFAENKKHNRRKWQKAVGEFVAEVENQIYIPPAEKISETARISSTATIGRDAVIKGSPRIEDRAEVSGNATVKDFAVIRDNARIVDQAVVGGFVQVSDKVAIGGNAVVVGDAVISGKAVIYENARIEGKGGVPVIGDSARVRGNAYITGNTRILGSARVTGGNWNGQVVRYGTWRKPPQYSDDDE